MKNIMKTALCGLVLCVLAAGTTIAGSGGGGGKLGKGPRLSPEELFAKMDADGSGEVTLEELTAEQERRIAAMKERRGGKERPDGARTPPPPEKILERLDENGDGVLTQVEMKNRRP